MFGFDKPITGDIRSLHMDVPMPDDTEVRDRLPSETLDLVGDLGRTTESPLSGFGKPITGDIHSLHICLHVRQDEDSSLLDMPFVSVNHPMFGDFNSEFGDVYEWVDADVPGDEIVPEVSFCTIYWPL